MAIFHCYVSSPEGNNIWQHLDNVDSHSLRCLARDFKSLAASRHLSVQSAVWKMCSRRRAPKCRLCRHLEFPNPFKSHPFYWENKILLASRDHSHPWRITFCKLCLCKAVSLLVCLSNLRESLAKHNRHDTHCGWCGMTRDNQGQQRIRTTDEDDHDSSSCHHYHNWLWQMTSEFWHDPGACHPQHPVNAHHNATIAPPTTSQIRLGWLCPLAPLAPLAPLVPLVPLASALASTLGASGVSAVPFTMALLSRGKMWEEVTGGNNKDIIILVSRLKNTQNMKPHK